MRERVYVYVCVYVCLVYVGGIADAGFVPAKRRMHRRTAMGKFETRLLITMLYWLRRRNSAMRD